MARTTMMALGNEAPGSDPLDLPAIVTVSYGLAARTIAELVVVVELSTSPGPAAMLDAGRRSLALVSTGRF